MELFGRAERVEVDAYRDLALAAPAALAAEHGVELATFGPLVCTAVRSLGAVSVLNRVLGLGAAELPPGEAALDGVCAWYDANGCTPHASIDPNAAAAGILELLAQRGFQSGYAWTKFVVGADQLDAAAIATRRDETLRAADATIIEVGRAAARAFGATIAQGFGMPPFIGPWLEAIVERPGWYCSLALVGGEPAAAGALYVDGRAGWLGMGSVLPAFRGRRLQSALLAARIAQALACECDLVTTETGVREADRPAFSYANILAAGLLEAYERPMLVRPPSH